jgi:hypothetical protein
MATPRSRDWKLDFEYVPEHDAVVVRYGGVVLEDEADAVEWHARVGAEFRRLGKSPVDVLIDLDGLSVKPSASRLYGVHRLAIIKQFCRRTFRFGGSAVTRTSVFTSSVIERIDANVLGSYEDALRALQHARRA